MQRLARVIPHVAVALLAAGLLVPGIVAPREASAKNLVEVNNRTKVITITVQADLVGGDADYAEYLQQSFNEHWGQEFEYRCYTVKISLDIKVFPAGELPADDAPRHRIVVNEIDPGDPYRATTQKPPNYRPSGHSGQLNLSNYSYPGTIAHEFGHILGLPDEYTYVDTNGDGSPSAGEVSIPDPSFPDVEWSLMADSRGGSVLQRHIDRIAGLHAPRGSIECKWQGSLDYRRTGTDSSGQQTWAVSMAFTMEEDDAGALEGTGSATLTHEGGGTYACGVWTDRMEPVTVEIAVSGERFDEGYMVLVFAPLGDTQTVETSTVCGNSSSETYDAWIVVGNPSVPAPPAQQGNTFVVDEYLVIPGPDSKSEYWTVILIEPAVGEGESVG